MKPMKRRGASRFAAAFLALGLALSACPATTVHAQEEPAAEGDSSGRPLDGYFGTAALAFLALFIVGKSARR